MIQRIDEETDISIDNIKRGQIELSKYLKKLSSRRGLIIRMLCIIFVFIIIFVLIIRQQLHCIWCVKDTFYKQFRSQFLYCNIRSRNDYIDYGFSLWAKLMILSAKLCQIMAGDAAEILGHNSAHSFAMGPVMAEPFISPFGLTMTPALSTLELYINFFNNYLV